MARIWRRPPTDSQQETEALDQTAYKEPNALNNYVSLQEGPSPVKPSNENSALTATLITAFQQTLK